MEMIGSRQLKQKAQKQLSQASYSPRRLALIHAGIALGCSLVLSIINYLLARQVSGTGGLSGIGTRSVLQTAQSVLSLALTVGMPFWEFGFVAAAMRLARQQPAVPGNLTWGFKRFFPLLRMSLLQTVLYVLVLLLACQVASMLIALTPLANDMMVQLEVLAQNPQFLESGAISDEMLLPLLQSMVPVYVATGVVFAVIAIPLSYRLRLTRYIVLDGHSKALVALRASRQLMRGNCMAYFKLDLSFWWYWLLQAACSLLAFGDVLLALAGVKLPISADVATFLFYGLQMVASIALAWRWRAPVETTYALAYDSITGKVNEEIA